MRKKYFTLLLCLCAIVTLSMDSSAQSRLIHYWSFNSFTNIDTLASTGCIYPVTTLNRIRPVSVDYTITDTTVYKAKLFFTRQPGVTNAWPQTSLETVCFTWMDFVAGTTVNARSGAVAGNGLRPRNPLDSMQIVLYIPTTNYQNIVIKYASMNSSATSGPVYMLYDYSLDSGLTWTKTGLSKLKDSCWTSAFNMTTISITDPLANNNPKLVLRIRDSIHTTGASGNIRYDNFTVEGDTLVLPSPSKLIHFWSFNNSHVYMLNPNFFPVPADYSTIDTSKAKVLFGTIPGTSIYNPTYFDSVATALADGDTINSFFGVPGGNGIRMRNPNDSTQLFIYMPTTNYKNIVLKYATESSSVASGDSIQVFDYSVDSGATWRIDGLSEIKDSAYTYFKLVTVSFTDPAANNNPKLVFRIKLLGHNKGTSGNNRFDNISVQGDSIYSTMPAINTTPASYGPFCSSVSTPISVGYTTSGIITSPYSVQITNANGTFPTDVVSNIIGTGTSSPISATVPSGTTAGTLYRVRVVNGYPVTYGSDNGSNITVSSALGPISGTTVVCQGQATTLSNGTSGGSWTSSNTAIITVGSGSGTVTGISVTGGTATITYAVPSGCFASATYTVNPLPANITGASSVCAGLTTALRDVTSGGAWSSGNTTVATVGTGSGTVSGIVAGTTTLTYTTIVTGCLKTASLTVNISPSSITGTTTLCATSATTLSDAGGGAWSSNNTSLATVGSGTGVVTTLASGSPVITYTLPDGCFTTTPLTVNPLPAPISGANGCAGVSSIFTDATAFGAWSSSNGLVASVGSSTGVVTGVALGTATISYTLSTGCYITLKDTVNSVPAAITGSTTVECAASSIITLSDATSGGTWSSGNTYIATVSSGGGIVTGVAGGNVVITYTVPTGCIAQKTVTINPLPAPVSGASSVYCIGSTTTLSDATPGGVWSSNNTSVATIGSGTGFVTGVAAGISTVTYALPTGCFTTIPENISSSPAPISGSNVCQGLTTNFTDATAFGAWSSSDITIANIGSGTGVVTGVSAGTATITYQLSSACVTSTTITVSPPPASITGINNVCVGSTTTLSDANSGGIWTSSVPYLATVGSATGVVTGLVPSILSISYTMPTGCLTTTSLVVNPLPTISGLATVCIGSTSLLTGNITGGTWSSSNTAVATVGSISGIVSGVILGTSMITYTLPTGCQTTMKISVISLPAAISGTMHVCAGLTTTLSDAGGGGWYSSDLSVAYVGFGTGVVSGVNAGTAVITYSLGTSCNSYSTITVNPLPFPITGITTVCQSSTTALSDVSTGGLWSSSNTATATIGAGTGIVTGVLPGTSRITYTLPTGCLISTTSLVNPILPITGVTNVCAGLTDTLADALSGGTWSSSNTTMAIVAAGTGVVTGISAGFPTITYSLPTGCMAMTAVTVNSLPLAITGTMNVCKGLTTNLMDATTGGIWSSNNTSVATIGAVSGIVTGISASTASVTYTLPTGCIMTTPVTVNPLPSSITGTTNVCVGLTVALSDAGGGSWSSSNSAMASVDAVTGVVTGVSAGTPHITYTLSTGCIVASTITVNPLPSVIGGTPIVCENSNITLSDFGGGTWSSSNPGLAEIDTFTGVLKGLSAGAPTITYKLATGCIATAVVTVNPVPYVITGSIYVCIGLTTTLSDVTPGGTWSSSTTTLATIGSSTGIVTGIATGSVNITYMLTTTGCLITDSIAVNPTITPIIGANRVCAGSSTTLSDASAGTWSSSNTSLATVGSATGVVTGISTGAPVITYTIFSTGCYTTSTFTVNPTPALYSMTGGGDYCEGGIGYHVGLSGSESSLINYQLFKGTLKMGSALPGSTLPLDYGLQTGAGTYKVVATNTSTGCNSNMSGSTKITVTLLVSPFVSVSKGIGDTLCSGLLDTFTALPTNPGPTPVYQWSVNGKNVGTNSLSYSYVPDNLDVVAVTMVSDAYCVKSPAIATGEISIDFKSINIPAVSIIASPGNIIYKGENVTLTASATNAGPNPTYQWIKNKSIIAGATSSTYSSAAFANKDSVSCIVTSAGPCGVPSFNSIIMQVSTGVNEIVAENGDIRLVPNPNNGMFAIKGALKVTTDQEVSLEITNMLGQVIYNHKLIAHNGSLDEQIQLNNTLANGSYILNLHSAGMNKMFRFVVGQ